MSTTQNNSITEYELFAAWSDDQETGQPKPLATWLAEYPEYVSRLVQWAADKPVYDLADTRAVTPAEEAEMAAVGRAAYARISAQMDAEKAANAPRISDLYQAAQQQGLRPRDLAARLGVGLPVVAKLQNRLVQASSLPNALIAQIAEALSANVEAVRAYLSQPAVLPAGAMYRSDDAPQVPPQESFADAIRNCAGMTEAQKRFWLDAE